MHRGLNLMAKNFKTTVKSADAVPEVIKFLEAWDFEDGACQVKISAVGSTLDYKAVFWIWMRELASAFTKRSANLIGKIDKSTGVAYKTNYSAEEMHDIVCHTFLGYTGTRKINKTVIQSSLRTITYPTDLDRGDFYHFMWEIDQWAAGNGVVFPEYNSAYQDDKNKQNGQ